MKISKNIRKIIVWNPKLLVGLFMGKAMFEENRTDIMTSFLLVTRFSYSPSARKKYIYFY